MLHTEKEGTPEFDEIKKLKTKMAEMFNKFEDFKVLAATLQTEAPVRDAYKAVFNIDKPELDPNTPEGMRKKKRNECVYGENQ